MRVWDKRTINLEDFPEEMESSDFAQIMGTGLLTFNENLRESKIEMENIHIAPNKTDYSRRAFAGAK